VRNIAFANKTTLGASSPTSSKSDERRSGCGVDNALAFSAVKGMAAD